MPGHDADGTEGGRERGREEEGELAWFFKSDPAEGGRET